MDHEAIARSVVKTSKVLVLHEANKTMGIGAEIAAFVAEELFMELDGPVGGWPPTTATCRTTVRRRRRSSRTRPGSPRRPGAWQRSKCRLATC